MIILSECSQHVSAQELEFVFGQYGFKLPADVLNFYRYYNGGTPSKGEVKGEKYLFPVHQFDDVTNILLYKRDLDCHSVPQMLDHKKTFPFACDQGGNTYALYFENHATSVYFYTTSDDMTVFDKWESFTQFINSFQ